MSITGILKWCIFVIHVWWHLKNIGLFHSIYCLSKAKFRVLLQLEKKSSIYICRLISLTHSNSKWYRHAKLYIVLPEHLCVQEKGKNKKWRKIIDELWWWTGVEKGILENYSMCVCIWVYKSLSSCVFVCLLLSHTHAHTITKLGLSIISYSS